MSIRRKLSDWKIRNPGKIPEWPKKAAFKVLRATQSMRCMPDYCIIGAQKSGTTSLYSYLALHPQVKPSYVKEIHYYNKHYGNGLKWYRAHFPVGSLDPSCRNFITGEASTMYLHDTKTPVRMFKDVPDVKLMLVLRNPVDRAISHYHHRVRSGREKRTIDEAMHSALCRVSAGDFESGTETDFLAYGCYAEYLNNWHKVFQPKQFLVMQAEAFFADPLPEFRKVSEFLGIDYLPPVTTRHFNAGEYKKEDLFLREELASYFRAYNEELYRMAQIDFFW